MISMPLKYLEASATNFVASTEPIEKFGTIAITAELPASLVLTRSIFSLVQPLVPTINRKLFSIAKSTTRSETSGFVKSMTKSAPRASFSELAEPSAL